MTSDATAIYELIKNAFDARSKKVEIRIFIVLRHSKYRELLAYLVAEQEIL
jgi:hypothetical protein